MEQIKPGQCVTITERKCSPKVQPNIQVGDIYLVHAVDKTAKGTEVLVLYRNNKECRCNADRFSWAYWDAELQHKILRSKKIAAMGVMAHAADQAAWEIEKKRLFNEFTFAEQAKISYVPLIVCYIAWLYADKTIAAAAKYKISATTKLSRAVKMLREKYMDYLREDLDVQHLHQIRSQAQRFMNDHHTFFAQLYFTVLNSINHQHVGIAYDDLRTYAFISKMLLTFLYEFENQMTDFIRQRLGKAKAVHLPHTEALCKCMDAYLGDYKIEVSKDVEIALNVFINEINKIEYVVKS